MSDVVTFTGDSMSFDIVITNNAGDEVNVSTASAIEYAIYTLDGTAEVTKTLGVGITVNQYVVTVTLEPEDTADLVSGLYVHEMRITLASGTVHTVLQDEILLRQSYIEALP